MRALTVARGITSCNFVPLVLLTLPTGAHAQGQTTFRGPYLQAPTTDSITVVWESPALSTGLIRYGAGPALAESKASARPALHHEVRLTGLLALTPPGGEIRYQLEVGGHTYPGRFRVPVEGTTPFSFIVYGDNRSSAEQHQVVVDALMREAGSVSFAVNSGDLVSSGQNESDWDSFFMVAAPFLARVPLYVALGNHEVGPLRNRWDVPQRIFVLPTDVAPASNSEAHYRVVTGNVDLIVINVEVDSLYTLPFLAGDQEAWLTNVLESPAPGAQHRFLVIHQGPYSSKVGRNGNHWLRQWLDRLKSAGIDAIFSGHDHYAERGYAANGIPYIIHGGGGAPLYATRGLRTTSDHTLVYAESRLGYARVDIDGPRAKITLHGIGGEVVDELRYGDAAAPMCLQSTDCGPPPRYGCPNGAWECVKNACRFTCPEDSGGPIACVTDLGCEGEIGPTCSLGTVNCNHPSINPASWFCECVPTPDCAQNTDCTGRASPVAGCTGQWACVDEVCEFTTELCLPVADAGAGQGDAPTSSADGDTVVPSRDAGSSLDATRHPAADAIAAPIGDAGGDTGPGGGRRCACTRANRSAAQLAPWLLALLFMGVTRRPRR